MCATDHHDMTLAVKVALNPNTTNQPISSIIFVNFIYCVVLVRVYCISVGKNGFKFKVLRGRMVCTVCA